MERQNYMHWPLIECFKIFLENKHVITSKEEIQTGKTDNWFILSGIWYKINFSVFAPNLKKVINYRYLTTI